MPRIKGTNDTQSKFLRSFITNPAGPAADAWPSPVVFRRWLKNPHFRHALAQLQHAYRLQADLQLSSAACSATSTLQLGLSPSQLSSSPSEISNLKFQIEHSLSLLRLSHVRQRFPLSTRPPRPPKLLDPIHVESVELVPGAPHHLRWEFSEEIDLLESGTIPELLASPSRDEPEFLSPLSCTLQRSGHILAVYQGDATFTDRSPWQIIDDPQDITFYDQHLFTLRLPQYGRVWDLSSPAPQTQ